MAEIKFAFPRKATGLVRELGWWSAFSVSVSYTVGSGLNKYLVYTQYWHPGANMPLAYLLGAIPVIFLAYIYTEMGIMMPRSGGDYVWVTRVLDPGVGFLANWLYFVANNFATGLLAVIGAEFWGYSIHLIGILTGDPGLMALGSWLQTDIWAKAAIAVVIVTIYTLLGLVGVRVFRWYLATVVAIGIAGSVMGTLVAAYAAMNPAYAKSAWDSAYGAGAWEEVEKVAVENGWEEVPESMSATFGAFADTFWAYWGVTAAQYFGGEMKSPKSGFIAGVFACALFMMAFYVTAAFAIYGAYGTFISKYDYVVVGGYADQLKIMSPLAPNLPLFLAPLAKPWPILAMIVSVIPALWVTNCAGSTLLVGPRQPFAWSFDRFFPEIFCRVNERFHSPHWAVLLTAAIAYIYIPMALANLFFAMIDTTFLFMLRCVVGALAGVVLPYRRRDIWEKGFKFTIAGVPLISVIGILAVFWWFWGLMIVAAWMDFISMGYLAFWIALGMFIWWAYAEYNTKRGIPPETIYTVIPPA